MSIIVRCSNGHFYDAEISKTCPYCSEQDIRRRQFEERIERHPEFTSQGIEEDKTIAMLSGSNETVFLSGNEFPIEGVSSDGSDATVGVYSPSTGNSPVTGWLVGLSGKVRGRDYRIHHGIQWVGRSYSSDIIISDVDGAAEQKHCGIVYDGKYNQFYIIPGSGNITYCNEKIVESATELRLGDVITIGNSSFEFVPFCREGHTWDRDYTK